MMDITRENIVNRLSLIEPDNSFFFPGSTFEDISAVGELVRRYFGVRDLSVNVTSVNAEKLMFTGMAEPFVCLGKMYGQTELSVIFSVTDTDFMADIRFQEENTGTSDLLSYLERTYALNVQTISSFVCCSENGSDDNEVSFCQSILSVYKKSERNVSMPWLLLSASGQYGMIAYDSYHDQPGEGIGFEDLLALGGISIQETEACLPEEIRKAAEQILLTDFYMGFSMGEGADLCDSYWLRVRLSPDSPSCWKITDNVVVENLEFVMNMQKLLSAKTGEMERTFGLQVGGTVRLWDREIPVQVSINNNGNDLYAVIGNGEDKIVIADLRALAPVTGENLDIGDYLPADYKAGELYFRQISLELALGSNGTAGFSFDVGMEEKWRILDLFEIDEIELYFSRKEDTFFVLTGKFEIAEVPIAVEIIKSDDYSITGYTLTTETVPISNLIEACTGRKADIPDISLKELRFSCVPAKQSYSFRADAEFLGCEFVFEVEFAKEGGKLHLIFADDPKKFNLEQFIRSLGFSELTIPECFNLALEKVEFEYDLSDDKMLLSVSAVQGTVFFQSDLEGADAGQRRYIFLVRPQFEIGLSDLPFAGSMLPDQCNAGISELMLAAVSEDIENLPVKGIGTPFSAQKGCSVSVLLTLQDYQEKIGLKLYGGDDPKEAFLCETKRDGAAICQDPVTDERKNASSQFQVGKVTGPVSFRGISFSFEDGSLAFGISASVSSSLLLFEMEGLYIRYDMAEKKAGFGLKELEVEMRTGTVTAGGGFTDRGQGEYAGALLISAGDLKLSAVGLYKSGNSPSLTAFGLVKTAAIGPPCFAVTGFAGGLGYSRSLVVPPIESLEQFPVMQVVSGEKEVNDLLDDMETYFPEKEGSNWFAAGITANSFNMVDTSVILTVQMDREPVINILGCATIVIPHGAREPIAEAGLFLRVAINPASGCIPVSGILRSDSYVLSRNCHLSGGFAFYTWYGGAHAGDFVISLGGYHNHYQKPAHYPAPQRLALSWRLSRELSVQGSLYFALTPSAVMAGGDLQMDFEWKCVKAWFHAYVDILMCWKPYYYEFSIGVSIGVRVNLKLFKVQLELGTDLTIWGPEFSGVAHIHLWIISFSISFGAGTPAAGPISISEFRKSFLPETEGVTAGKEETFGGVDLILADGLISSSETDGSGRNVVSGQRLVIKVTSKIPVVKICLNQDTAADKGARGETSVCLRPCSSSSGEVSVSPVLTVRISRQDQTEADDTWEMDLIEENVPSALWGDLSYEGETLSGYTGIRIRAKNKRTCRSLLYTAECREDGAEHSIPVPASLPSKTYDQTKVFEELGKIGSLQDEIRNAFADLPGVVIDLEEFGDPRDIFNAAPVLASTGGKVNG